MWISRMTPSRMRLRPPPCHSPSTLAYPWPLCLEAGVGSPSASSHNLWEYSSSGYLLLQLAVIGEEVFQTNFHYQQYLPRSESEFGMSQYKTLSAYFTRRLRPGVRPISVIGDLVSPADGTITVSSPLKHSGFTHMVKGLQYSLDIFLGSLDNIGAVIWDNDNDSGCIYDDGRSEVSETSEPSMLSPSLPAHFQLLLNNCDNSTQLYETTIYLSPGDYHRLVSYLSSLFISFHPFTSLFISLSSLYHLFLYPHHPFSYFYHLFSSLFIPPHLLLSLYHLLSSLFIS